MVEEKRRFSVFNLFRQTTPKPQDRTVFNPGIQEKDTSYYLTTPIIYNLAKQSAIVRTCTTQLKQEIFRRGYVWEEKFALQCKDCGEEHKGPVETCSNCDSTNLEKPEILSKKKKVQSIFVCSPSWESEEGKWTMRRGPQGNEAFYKNVTKKNFQDKDADSAPVFVVDSDGLEPRRILDYIRGIVGGDIGGSGDSVRLLHVQGLLSMLRTHTPNYEGKFGVLVQHANKESARFTGFDDQKTSESDKKEAIASTIKAAWIARPQPFPKSKFLNHKTVNFPFLEQGGREKILDEILSAQPEKLFSEDPVSLVQHINSVGRFMTGMTCSGYISKENGMDKVDFSSLGINMRGIPKFRPDDFTFEWFDTSTSGAGSNLPKHPGRRPRRRLATVRGGPRAR